jgi:hypothetical protein
MKTLDQLLTYTGNTFDGRDVVRLASFLKPDQYARFGLALKEGADPSTIVPEPLTEENVKRHLTSDLAFAFEKALNKRGLSAGSMYSVIKMWMWVLDDPLWQWSDDSYAQYGLPLLKAVALQYGLPNPLGNDSGTEDEYSAESGS